MQPWWNRRKPAESAEDVDVCAGWQWLKVQDVEPMVTLVFSTRNGRRSWDFSNLWTGGYWWMIAKLVDRSMNLGVSYKSAGFMVFFAGWASKIWIAVEMSWGLCSGSHQYGDFTRLGTNLWHEFWVFCCVQNCYPQAVWCLWKSWSGHVISPKEERFSSQCW